MLKKILIFIAVLTLLCANVYAHSGRTDGAGGHNSPSGYHYHHGYSAHQHPDGICPYDDRYSNYAIIEKEKEDDNSPTYSVGIDGEITKHGTSVEEEEEDETSVLEILLVSVGMLTVLGCFFKLLEYLANKNSQKRH